MKILVITLLLFQILCPRNMSQPAIPLTENAGIGIRMVSYNIRYNNPGDNENAWPFRKEKVAGLLAFHKVEIAGLQEVLKDQLDDLETLMPGFGWFGAGRTDGKTEGEFAPVFYLKSRFEILETGTFWLSETPGKPSKGWDAALNRIVTWGKLFDKSAMQSFYIFNTHFDHQGKEARAESARLLTRKIYEVAGPAPVVVTGDFNFTDEDEPYTILTGGNNPHRIEDALLKSQIPHYGPLSTFAGGFDEACKPGKKIDYIFIKNQVSVMHHGILTDSRAGICPSDHMPVLAEVIINP